LILVNLFTYFFTWNTKNKNKLLFMYLIVVYVPSETMKMYDTLFANVAKLLYVKAIIFEKI